MLVLHRQVDRMNAGVIASAPEVDARFGSSGFRVESSADNASCFKGTIPVSFPGVRFILVSSAHHIAKKAVIQSNPHVYICCRVILRVSSRPYIASMSQTLSLTHPIADEDNTVEQLS
jgi:hypothetical protein